MAVELLAVSFGIRLKASGEVEYGVGPLDGEWVLLGRPRTYMNLSGRAVAPLYERFAGVPEDLLVLHDDLDLALGVVRLKRGGGGTRNPGIPAGPDRDRPPPGRGRPGGFCSQAGPRGIAGPVPRRCFVHCGSCRGHLPGRV